LSAGSGFDLVEESGFRAKIKAVEHQDRQPPGGFRFAPGAFPLTRFPIEWNHSIEKASLKIKSRSRSLAKKSGTFFKECSKRGSKQRPCVAVVRAAGHSGVELMP
jgi:hypothetical protein